MSNSRVAFGTIIFLIGLALLFNNLGLIDIDLSLLWPLFLIIPGLALEIGYFTGGKDAGTLVPAGMLITYGLVFFANIIWGWHNMAYLWPFFPLGVAIGLLQLYLFARRDAALLIPIAILGGFSAIGFMRVYTRIGIEIVFPVALIILGVLLLFNRKK
ncbi:MAG: DUF5668 domain-containing protein [Firmicutes bacterium]|nr:DUF5668 domain-containing protein [Bacillota bacterium]